MIHPLNTYLSAHPKKTIIFDLDRTLIELRIDWSGVYDNLCNTAHMLFPNIRIAKPQSSLEFYSLYSDLVTQGNALIKQKLDMAIESYEVSHYHGYTPNPVLLAFIRTNTSRYTYALWTSNTRGAIEDFIVKESFGNVFKTIVTLNDVQLAKPNPEGFSIIYDGKSDKNTYVMVGDRSIDHKAATFAGIDYFQEEYFNNLA